jgi:hypothetical protein
MRRVAGRPGDAASPLTDAAKGCWVSLKSTTEDTERTEPRRLLFSVIGGVSDATKLKRTHHWRKGRVDKGWRPA